MHEVAGITMIQVLASSIIGYMSHRRSGHANADLVLGIGIPMGLCSFAGAAVSGFIRESALSALFGLLVALAFVLLLAPASDESGSRSESFRYDRYKANVCGASVGLFSGIVGAGGGFVLIPAMVRFLRVPMRMTVGSSLGIIFIGSLMGSLGKVVSLQINWLYLLPVIAGSLPAALLGARVSKKVAPRGLRLVLLGLVFVILVKTWYDLLKVFL